MVDLAKNRIRINPFVGFGPKPGSIPGVKQLCEPGFAGPGKTAYQNQLMDIIE
jgi:hypothetical protein